MSFEKDIRPLFTDIDVMHMRNYGLDLANRDSVAKMAKEILATVTEGTMPPPKDGRDPWTKEMCATFQQWMDQGCPP